MMRFGLVIAILSGLAACASPVSNYHPMVTRISEPEIGAVKTTGLGEIMVVQGRRSEHDAILLRQHVVVGTLATYTFTPGYYLKEGDGPESAFYQPEDSRDGGRVERSMMADRFRTLEVFHSGKKICGVNNLGSRFCKGDVAFERVTRPAPGNDGFEQRLRYEGHKGERVFFIYEETSGRQARPSYRKALSFDLAEGGEIGYRGARLEVIKADSRSITFRMVSGFSSD